MIEIDALNEISRLQLQLDDVRKAARILGNGLPSGKVKTWFAATVANKEWEIRATIQGLENLITIEQRRIAEVIERKRPQERVGVLYIDGVAV